MKEVELHENWCFYANKQQTITTIIKRPLTGKSMIMSFFDIDEVPLFLRKGEQTNENNEELHAGKRNALETKQSLEKQRSSFFDDPSVQSPSIQIPTKSRIISSYHSQSFPENVMLNNSEKEVKMDPNEDRTRFQDHGAESSNPVPPWKRFHSQNTFQVPTGIPTSMKISPKFEKDMNKLVEEPSNSDTFDVNLNVKTEIGNDVDSGDMPLEQSPEFVCKDSDLSEKVFSLANSTTATDTIVDPLSDTIEKTINSAQEKLKNCMATAKLARDKLIDMRYRVCQTHLSVINQNIAWARNSEGKEVILDSLNLHSRVNALKIRVEQLKF